jgi:hypothetical protein
LLLHAFCGLLGDAFEFVSGLIGSASLASQAPGFHRVNKNCARMKHPINTAESLAGPVSRRPQQCNGAHLQRTLNQ